MFRRKRPTCRAISAQAWSCQPQITHSTLLAMKHQNPQLRFFLCWDPTSHAAMSVIAMAGHCSRLIGSVIRRSLDDALVGSVRGRWRLQAQQAPIVFVGEHVDAA